MTIFNYANMRQVGTPEFSIFGAEFDVDAASFVSNLPGLDFYNWVGQIDPALGKAFPENAFPTPVGNVDLRDLGYTAYAQFTSTIRAVRLVLSQIATTVGFLKQAVKALGDVFKGAVAAVGDALNIALQVLDNPGFNAAINSLCAIPIVGWIIKAVVTVAKLVLKIVETVRQNRAKRQEAWRQMRSLMPLAQWDPDIDAIQVRNVGLRLHVFDTAYVFMPRYLANSPGDFYAEQASGDPDSKRLDAWRLLTRHPDGGLGFVPGTQNLHGAIEMPVGFCAGVKDLGDFFPTAQQMAYQLWNTVLNEDTPALFTVPARRCEKAWESYLMSILAYTVRDISGWSCARDPQNGGSKVPSRDYLQGSGPYPTKQVDPNDSKNPKTVGIKGSGHRQAMLDHLQALFDWTKGRDTSISNSDPRFPETAVDFSKSAPGRALANLRDRQLFELREIDLSLMAAYVDDSRVRPGAGAIDKVPRWPAIADKNEELWTVWDQARRNLLSSDRWKQIELEDVPGGPNDPYRDKLTSDDRAFYQALVDKGLRPGGGPPQRPELGRLAAKPPAPPPPHGYLPDLRATPPPSRTSLLKAAGVAGATIAAAGAGYLVYRKVRADKHTAH
ncbi:hypothetical protein [Nannocystis pusilla]|uniref:hypothetical protein n=1 Tax=Nannocystis pusilla TaxID=889268 RepID=UPI003BF3342B